MGHNDDTLTPHKSKNKTNKPRPLVTGTYQGVAVGRAKTVVDPEEVFKLASLGCKNQEIANWFGIDENTMTYNFSDQLLKGRENLKHSLRRAQISLALSGNATMLIWLGKNLLGQSDQPLNQDHQQPLPWNTGGDQ